MRHLTTVAILCCAVHSVGARQPAGLSSAARTQILSQSLWRIAVTFKVRVGFQMHDRTPLGRLEQAPASGGATLEDAVNRAVGMDDRYEWHTVGDTVVVRPVAAWTDPADPLNRQVHQVQAASVSPTAVLFGLRDFLRTNRFEAVPKPSGGDVVSLRVQSGTVLDVLNELTTVAEQVMWVAYTRPADDEAAGWRLVLELRNASQLTSFSGS